MTTEKDMTLEELEEYKGIALEMKAIQMQIEELYNTGSCSSKYSNPTEHVVIRILNLQNEYEKKSLEMSEKLSRVENWLSSVEDAEIRSIVRFRFILNKTWQQTSTMVYGYPSYYTARKRIMRFFGKEL